MKKLSGVVKKSSPILVAIVAGFIGGWCATVTQSVSAQAPQGVKVVRASRFELIDAGGNVRGAFEAKPQPIFHLRYSNGKPGLVLHVNAEERPEIVVCRDDGKSTLTIGLDNENNPHVVMGRKTGKPAIVLGIDSAGGASAIFSNLNDKMAAWLGVGLDQSGSLSLLDAYGRQKQ